MTQGKMELSEYYSDSGKSTARVFLDEINGNKAYKVECLSDGYSQPHSTIFLSEIEAEEYAEDWIIQHG